MTKQEWKELTSLYAWKEFYNINKRYDDLKKINQEIAIVEARLGETLTEYYQKGKVNKKVKS